MDSAFFIGLDVGSDSVGWAAADEDFNLLRLKGKTAWGARLFEEASDAKGRRGFRTAGRRLARRKRRIEFLRYLFKNEIAKCDPNFFLKMQESGLHCEDRTIAEAILPKELEKEMNGRFPTIWHLRKALLDEKDPNHEFAWSDIRVVYLAFHHIVKYRGNFLIKGNLEVGKFDDAIFDEINGLLRSFVEDAEELDLPDFISSDFRRDLLKLLDDKETYKRDKKKQILNRLPDAYGKGWKECFATLVVGMEFDLKNVVDEEGESCKICFESKYDEQEDAGRTYLGDQFRLVECAKVIYDYICLKEMLNNQPYLSYAFSAIYDAHKEEKKILKELCHLIDDNEKLEGEDSVYYKVFKDPECDKNYPAFVHVNSKAKRPSIHDFNVFLLKTVFTPERDALINGKREYYSLKLLAEKQDRLLQTIAINSTSIIPHQLHEKELDILIEKGASRYPFLREEAEKIKSVFLFRVPYYYGPLNSDSPYSNVKFLSEKRVPLTPWNYADMIDDNATREAFMANLTNHCQYLLGETNVLPRQSILFMDYVTLNRLNGMVVNGVRIEQNVKEDLLEHLLWTKEKVTKAGIKKYLKANYPVYKKDDVSISGITDDAFDNSTRVVLSRVFNYEKERAKVERILFLLAVYCDDKEDAIAAVKKEFKDLNAAQEKAIRSLNVKGWSPFSQRLLKGIYSEVESTAEVLNIYDVMLRETKAFMEVLYDDRYGFLALIEKENQKFYGSEKSKEEIQEEILLTLPPKMRRAAIQSIRIVDEVVRAAKAVPEAISLEVTRTAPKKKEKGSVPFARDKELKMFLTNFAKKDKELNARAGAGKASPLEELKELEQNHELTKLKGKHVYLYFKQNGFDLYTGKTMQLSDVLAGKYDIDHIVPQSKLKDDGLDNCVLVSKEMNQRVKGDRYPIPEEIRTEEVVSLWKRLYKLGAISEKKYNNLMRTRELTDDELNAFVSAQLNVVNHANKGIVELIKNKYPQTKVIYSKAEFASRVRQEYGIPKLRDLNDTHHAVDAYLNIVTGVILHSTYGNLRVAKALQEKGEKVTTYNMFATIRHKLGLNGLAGKVKENCFRHDFLMSYRPSYVDGAFYDQTVYATPERSGKNALISMHDGLDINKYGGFNNATTEYMVLTHIKTPKKELDYLLPVKHLWVAKSHGNFEALRALMTAYVTELFGPDAKPSFGRKIYNDQLVEVQGCRYLLANSNEKQVVLKPVDPVYLCDESAGYLKDALLAEESLKAVPLNVDTFRHQFDSKGGHIVEFSKERNLRIAAEVNEIARLRKYDYFSNGIKAREVLGNEGLQSFARLSLWEQVSLLMDCLMAYGRSGPAKSKLLSSPFRKSRAGLVSDGLRIIDQSVTGL